MRALVVYESMFGGTRLIAEDVARALDMCGVTATTTICTAADAPVDVTGYGLVVVGAPTHARGLPWPASRSAAARWAADTPRGFALETPPGVEGVREWLSRLRLSSPAPVFAAFSTRVDIARVLAGDGSNAIARRLRALGAEHVERQSFRVSAMNIVCEGERMRAASWAAELPARARRIVR